MSKTNLKICKHCGKEIAKSAKVCPYCGGKNLPPIYKRPWFIVIILLFILGLIFSGSSKSNTTSQSHTSSTSTKQETIYAIGDAIATDKYEITITEVEEKDTVGNAYMNSTASEGGVYVSVNIKLKNISDKPLNSFEFPTIRLIDGNDTKYSSDISATSYYAVEKDPDHKVLSDLNPGITVTDVKVFEISSDSYSSGSWFVSIDNKLKVKIK